MPVFCALTCSVRSCCMRFPTLVFFACSPPVGFTPVTMRPDMSWVCSGVKPASLLFLENLGTEVLPRPSRYGVGDVPHASLPPSLSPSMASVSGDRVLCSQCARPWQSSRYRIYSRCLVGARNRLARSRLQLPTAVPLSLPTAPACYPSLPVAGLSRQRVLCSRYTRPWQSPRYRVCDDCRHKTRMRRRQRPLPVGASVNPVAQGQPTLPYIRGPSIIPVQPRKWKHPT
jgi:hypothetical protein